MVTIIQTKDGRYFAQRCKTVGEVESNLGKPGAKIRTQTEVEASVVESLLVRLGRARIAPFPEFPAGCDGGFTELEAGGYGGKASYRWWSVPPESWRELVEIADEVWGLASLEI